MVYLLAVSQLYNMRITFFIKVIIKSHQNIIIQIKFS